jgi:carboxyl-terminal processing protease
MRTTFLLLLVCLLGNLGIADAQNVSPTPHIICGIGAVVAEKNGSPLIIEVLPNGPAIKSGLKANDKIIQIDDTKVEGLNLKQVVELIRGQQGAVVKITVAREGESSPLTFAITREPVEIPVK